MYRFIESINYIDGKPQLLEGHQARLNQTFSAYFSEFPSHDLSQLLPVIPDHDQHKCRVVYDADSVEVEFVKYRKPEIHSLKLVQGNSIEYSHKFEDRNELTKLYEKRGEADDIIIVKNGKVTDTYYANLVLYDGSDWWTPDTYLLNGVMRQFLLEKGEVRSCPIAIEDLGSFSKVSLINAMNSLGRIEINVDSIILK
ncbi:aminotransferase class IV [Reichenbachiella ulvae]|uniref:Aminotransferase class IV n=1 Tax=Reichenbachiella ulvae TaxID=2980104 RepID=A0ABT3CPL2_9BACT|nr:aminotransferase class IV [Reichenbachiella ulvae]MCV9385626.1 aminotransferase class IV [Reichenbachiella ulvae]